MFITLTMFFENTARAQTKVCTYTWVGYGVALSLKRRKMRLCEKFIGLLLHRCLER